MDSISSSLRSLVPYGSLMCARRGDSERKNVCVNSLFAANFWIGLRASGTERNRHSGDWWCCLTDRDGAVVDRAAARPLQSNARRSRTS